MEDRIWLIIPGVSPTTWFHEITKAHKAIGRSVDCEIHIPDDCVSRRHAVVWRSNGKAHIRDADSTNGVFVNEKRVRESSIAPGDRIRLGLISLDVVTDPFERPGASDGEESTLKAHQESDKDMAVILRVVGEKLTPAQLQVTRLLIQGASEKQVAAKLLISRQTVHTHVKEIYRILDVHSRSELLSLFISSTVEMEFLGENTDDSRPDEM